MSNWSDIATKKARKVELEHILLEEYVHSSSYMSFGDWLKHEYESSYAEVLTLVALWEEGI